MNETVKTQKADFLHVLPNAVPLSLWVIPSTCSPQSMPVSTCKEEPSWEAVVLSIYLTSSPITWRFPSMTGDDEATDPTAAPVPEVAPAPRPPAPPRPESSAENRDLERERPPELAELTCEGNALAISQDGCCISPFFLTWLLLLDAADVLALLCACATISERALEPAEKGEEERAPPAPRRREEI